MTPSTGVGPNSASDRAVPPTHPHHTHTHTQRYRMTQYFSCSGAHTWTKRHAQYDKARREVGCAAAEWSRARRLVLVELRQLHETGAVLGNDLLVGAVLSQELGDAGHVRLTALAPQARHHESTPSVVLHLVHLDDAAAGAAQSRRVGRCGGTMRV